MKNQLALLLLAVLFVSLPSVVFAQPPLGAVQSGKASEAVPTPVTVTNSKSWKGPIAGLGLGLGVGAGTWSTLSPSFGWVDEDTPAVTAMPALIRLGYGLSDSVVLYGSVYSTRAFNHPTVTWSDPVGMLGMMFRGGWSRQYYGFVSLGATFEDDPGRTLYLRSGSGREVYPGLSVEGAGAVGSFNVTGVSTLSYAFELTFNYHFY